MLFVGGCLFRCWLIVGCCSLVVVRCFVCLFFCRWVLILVCGVSFVFWLIVVRWLLVVGCHSWCVVCSPLSSTCRLVGLVVVVCCLLCFDSCLLIIWCMLVVVCWLVFLV